MQLYAKITKDIALLAAVVKSGRIAAFPTGTSYGLAADALQGNALQRLRNLKGRNSEKTFTVCMQEDLWDIYIDLTDREKDFLHQHAQEAITLLVTPKKPLAHLARNGLVGLRVIDHKVMQELAQHLDVPFTATSANIAGESSCFDIACIQTSFPGLLEATDTRHGDIARAGKTTYDLSLGAIYDAGTLPHSKPSTIVQLTGNGSLQVIREGAATLAET